MPYKRLPRITRVAAGEQPYTLRIAWDHGGESLVDVSGLIFKLTVTPRLLMISIFWALTIGLIGASLPAMRAARLPVATALRAT